MLLSLYQKTLPPTTLTDVSKPKAQVSKFNQYITWYFFDVLFPSLQTVKKNDSEPVKPKGRQQKRKCSNATEKPKLKKKNRSVIL